MTITSRNRPHFDLGNALIGVTLLFVTLSAVLYILVSRQAKPEYETKSAFSHIRIRREGNLRTLIFVRDNGFEAIESRIDLDAPHQLQLPYAQAMFASYLYQPQHERVLIVGLGGGAMVHFLRHYDPAVKVDVVEIDPVVVRLADEYFDVRNDSHLQLLTTDGFDFLANTRETYNVIYMDAFLRPSEETDATGVPSRLKTLSFYETLKQRLVPGGLVIFNLNNHRETDNDIRNIRDSFSGLTVFRSPPADNLVVVARTSGDTPDDDTLSRRAAELDQRFPTNFSFRKLLVNRVAKLSP